VPSSQPKKKFEEGKNQNQSLGNFKPSFGTEKKTTMSFRGVSEKDDQGAVNGILGNISVCRPSILSDVLTKDDFFEGLLEKQSPSFHKMWQKRYFVLKDRIFYYYKTKADYD